VDEPELWKQTEDNVREVLKNPASTISKCRTKRHFTTENRRAGVERHRPRIHLATNQVDFAVPRKFGLTYAIRITPKKTPLCIHRAPLGTHERLLVSSSNTRRQLSALACTRTSARPYINDEAPLVAHAKTL